MSGWTPADVGFSVRSKLVDLGASARLFARLLRLFGAAFARGAGARFRVDRNDVFGVKGRSKNAEIQA